MTWNNLGDFFDRFKKITPPEEGVIDYARQIINNEINESRKNYSISLNNGTLWIRGLNGSEKSAVYAVSGHIISLLSKRFGSKKVSSIKFN